MQKTLSPHKWINKIFKISGTKAAFSEEIMQEHERIVFAGYERIQRNCVTFMFMQKG